ncbi:helix-turn-helix domain-containing protein [Domibacillus iocasae]|uniref:Transcriptional regulator n=1 Tax=Domibacillus iocasae TaxID=1714016 RepID=A0A1E7DPR6_9BACI|nr:helix-turn-helix domain-containing protein [Domibacillus iocasae]OES44995.1 transcriptional regulator [Domibacillus iocasae]
MSIGERIRSFRLEKGMSLTELASRSDTAKSYISSVERDLQLNPSIQFLRKVSRVLDVNIEQLLNDSVYENSPVLDEEWMKLAREAMESGTSKEQFKEFLEFQKWQKIN